MRDLPIASSFLRQEYEQQKDLFENQPAITQRFLESQARLVAEGVLGNVFEIRFSLPDRIAIHAKQDGPQDILIVPESQRVQEVGKSNSTLFRRELRQAILSHLRELEHSSDQAVAASANLLRYATAIHMVYDLLPSGRSVAYRPEGNEDIPSIPVGDEAPKSAITQASDAVVELAQVESGRGQLQSPFVPSARKFYIPQWVAFDEDGYLLVGSEQDAEAYILSMQKYAQILHHACALAPYIIACQEYQYKRYGILGQLVNQGRALASFKTQTIIREIKERAAQGSLNRGLSITINYFDDQNLEMAKTRLEVIPPGRIMFTPAFVVRATRGVQANVSQDTRLNNSTRKHLLAQLKTLQKAFDFSI